MPASLFIIVLVGLLLPCVALAYFQYQQGAAYKAQVRELKSTLNRKTEEYGKSQNRYSMAINAILEVLGQMSSSEFEGLSARCFQMLYYCGALSAYAQGAEGYKRLEQFEHHGPQPAVLPFVVMAMAARFAGADELVVDPAPPPAIPELVSQEA